MRHNTVVSAELKDVKFQNLPTVPVNPTKGLIYFNSTTNLYYLWDGTSWVDLCKQGTVTAVTATGPLASTGGTTPVISLNDSGVVAGTYKNVTVNAKGLVTGGTNPTTLSGYGITDAVLTSEVVTVATANKILKLDVNGNLPASITGNAATATKLQSGKTIGVSGDATGSVLFDASANVAIPMTLANTGVAAGTYKSVTVDTKGRVTAGSNPTTLVGYGITDALNLAGGIMTGFLTLDADPTQPMHATTKQYVDAIALGLDVKHSVHVASTANITVASSTNTTLTLSAAITSIDGVTLAIGDRILLKNQTTASQNGIYIYSSSTLLTRSEDADTDAKISSGLFTFVEEGTVNADSGWILTTNEAIVLGTTGLTFVQFTGAGQVITGTGLTKNGNTLSITNTGIAAGTYKILTVNAQGQATAGSNPTTLAGFGIVDAAPLSHVGATGGAHGIVTAAINGFMSSADKIRLDGMEDNANNYIHPISGVSAGIYKSVSVDDKGHVVAGTNPTTLSGFGITDAQPLDADLTAIAGLSTNGFIVKTATGTAVTRSILVSGSGTSVSNADGIAGNPTINISSNSGNVANTLVYRDASGNFSAGTITAALSGNASTATKLQTARTIGTSGDATGSILFDGTANVVIPLTLASTGVASGTYKVVTVDAKGRVIAGTNPTTLDGFGITDALNINGGVMTGPLSLYDDPSQSMHAVTKQYVDMIALGGLDVKSSVHVASTGNVPVTTETTTTLTLTSDLLTMDGITLQVGDRILLKDQTDASQNGIYTYTTPTLLTRALDADSNADISPMMFTFVEEGALNDNSGWLLTNNGAITVGSTPLTFVQFTGAGQIIAGTGLAKNGNTIYLASTGIAAGGYRSVVVNAQGQVISGSNPSTLAGYGIADAAPLSHVGTNGNSHGVVTTSVNGFMSAADKAKLDGISAGSNNYSHPLSGVAAGTYQSVTVDTQGHVTAGSNPTTLAGFGITDATPSSHIGSTGTAHGLVSTSVHGFMSSSDKTKLDGIATNANNYVHPTSGVTAGTYKSVTVDGNGHITAATNPTTLAGFGITDAAPSSHVGSNGGAHAAVTTTVNGFMIASDKSKLDGIAAGANAYVHPTSGVGAGTYRSVTVDTNGHVTAGSNPTTVAGYGITDAVKITGSTMTGALILNADPTQAMQAATKQYVDNFALGLDVKPSVHVATVGNLSATAFTASTITFSSVDNAPAIDGVTLVIGDRILVKNQTTASQNGIYNYTSITANGSTGMFDVLLTRSADADTSIDVTSGMFVFVEEGTVNDNSGWILTTNGVITIGTTAMDFAQFSGGGQIIAGTGLVKNGNTLSLATSGIAAGTYIKTTVDTYGRVTAGSALTAADIPVLDWSKITSGKPTTLAGYGITDGLGLAGGTMTGNITFVDDQEGILWNRNTDMASIKFYNTGDADTASRLEFNVGDNGDEYFRWTGTVASVVTELMKLMPNDATNGLTFRGNKVWHAGNDGTGSGLDADTVRGARPSITKEANQLVQYDANGNIIANTIDATTPNIGSTGGVRIRANATTNVAYLQFTNNTADSQYGAFKVASTGEITWNDYKVWHAGNDGAGSTLDSDLLDGMQPATTNTANTIVQRDASGNFSAGTITASLAGNAATANVAKSFIVNNLASNQDLNALMTEGTWGSSTTVICGSLLNKPANMPAGECRLTVEVFAANYIMQTLEAKSQSTFKVYKRVYDVSAWSAWKDTEVAVEVKGSNYGIAYNATTKSIDFNFF